MSTQQDFEKTPESHCRLIEDQECRPRTDENISKERSARKRLGTKNIVILIGGTIVVLVAVLALILLWVMTLVSIKRGYPPRGLRHITKHMAKIVTAACVLIRLATGLQLSVFAAILAALILERVGANRAELPKLSMLRFSNNGPNSLILNTWHSRRIKPQMMYSTLVVLGFLTGLALQMISTILIGDFENKPLDWQPDKGSLYYGLPLNVSDDWGELFEGANYWASGGSSFTPFVEWRANGSNVPNYADTGPTYRGFLPVTNLTGLRYYNGPATMVDMRVICSSPNITNITFGGLKDGEYSVLNGTLEFTNAHPALKQGLNATQGFSCELPLAIWPEVTYSKFWQLSLCNFNTGVGEITQGIQTAWNPTSAGMTAATLMINVTGDWYDWASAASAGNTSLAPLNLNAGPWASYEQNDRRVDMSLCFINPAPHDYLIETKTKVGIPDTGVFLWGLSDVFDDELFMSWYGQIFAYLGVVSPRFKPKVQPKLEFHPPSNWSASRVDQHHDDINNYTTNDFLWNLVNGTAEPSSWILVPFTNYTSIYRSQYVIAQAILRETNDPALAVQSLFTMVMNLAYQDLVDQFSITYDVDSVSVGLAYVPVQWKGLSGVLALLAYYFLLLAVAVKWFTKYTEVSLLGRSWQAILHVVSLNKRASQIPNAHDMSDKEMLRVLGEDERLRIVRLN